MVLPASLMALTSPLAERRTDDGASPPGCTTQTTILIFLAFFFLAARASAARSEASLGFIFSGIRCAIGCCAGRARPRPRRRPATAGSTTPLHRSGSTVRRRREPGAAASAASGELGSAVAIVRRAGVDWMRGRSVGQHRRHDRQRRPPWERCRTPSPGAPGCSIGLGRADAWLIAVDQVRVGGLVHDRVTHVHCIGSRRPVLERPGMMGRWRTTADDDQGPAAGAI